MKIWILSVVFVECKAVDFKDKNAGCEGGIIRKKAAIVGALERKFRSIFISNSSLHIARASSRRCVAHQPNCADRTASFR